MAGDRQTTDGHRGMSTLATPANAKKKAGYRFSPATRASTVCAHLVASTRGDVSPAVGCRITQTRHSGRDSTPVEVSLARTSFGRPAVLLSTV